MSGPLDVLQKRMDDSENSSTFPMTSEEARTVEEYLKVFDQVTEHLEFINCMYNSYYIGNSNDFESLLKYSDWFCRLNEAHVNFSSISQSELLHKDLQTYLKLVYDSFLSGEMVHFRKVITSMFSTLISWNFTSSDRMSNFSKMEFVFNFSGPEIENILIAAFNTGTIDVIMAEFLDAFVCFVDQCMKFSFINSYSITEGPISTVTLTEDNSMSTGPERDIRRKCTMKFAEGFPVEYQIKLKNFISKTDKDDIPRFKLDCLINFLEQFYKDVVEIFKSASCDITDGGRFSLLSYIGEHGLSSKIIERVHDSVSDVIKLAYNNPDDVAKFLEKVDTVMMLYISSGLVSEESWISFMGTDTSVKDRITTKMCGEILSWVKNCCEEDFATLKVVGVPESAILHNISSYKDDVLWKVDRSNIKTIVNEGKDDLLSLKFRLIQCQIPVAAEKVTDYAIQLLIMHNKPDLYNTKIVEKTFNAFLETYINIIENNYGDRLTKEFSLAASFFNSCYFLTKRIGVYLNYSFSDDKFYNFSMMHAKLRNLACSALGYHLAGFKRSLSLKLTRGNIFIENCSEYSLSKNPVFYQFYNKLQGIIVSLKIIVTSGIFKIVVSEIMDEILNDIINTFTKMKALSDNIYYDNIVYNLDDFLSRIDGILCDHCDSTKLADLCPDAVAKLSQISIIISSAQYNVDVFKVSDKNLIFNNSSIKSDLVSLVDSIYPPGENKDKILDFLK